MDELLRGHLLDPPRVSEHLGVPIGTLYAWRHRGVGPPSIKVGRHIRYRVADVEQWLDDQKAAAPQ